MGRTGSVRWIAGRQASMKHPFIMSNTSELHEYTDEHDPDSIKYHVKKFLVQNKERFPGWKIIDFPAGNGVTSLILRDIGAVPLPFDLFPEYFKLKGVQCLQADAEAGIPIAAGSADALVCQEGIEHFNDQLKVLKEFNRVLKPGGMLLITTPNYSNLRSKLSYLFSENERFPDLMPPNEKDSIWMMEGSGSDRIYFGHIFLTGIVKLRLLARLSGFRIREVHPTRISSTCLFLFPFLFPWIWLVNVFMLKKNLRKSGAPGDSEKAVVYREVFSLVTRPRVLLSKHLMVEFEKDSEVSEIAATLMGKNPGFGVT
jgi:SAM-dependent methyltransferase